MEPNENRRPKEDLSWQKEVAQGEPTVGIENSRVEDSQKGKRLYQITDEEVRRCLGYYDPPPPMPGRYQIPAVRENRDCRLDFSTGEILCAYENAKPPATDCREPWCLHEKTMRTRLKKRLNKVYAPDEKTKGEP